MSQAAVLAEDLPVLSEVVSMTADSAERSGLDDRTFFLVRIAALAGTGAPPSSWLVNLAAAADRGLTKEGVQDVLVAIAPVIGTARTVAAAGNALRGVGIATALSEADGQR